MSMNYINFNGSITSAKSPIICADSRGLKYGDGLFETMRMISGTIPLAPLHFERLFHGMELLKFDRPSYLTGLYFYHLIRELAIKNNHQRDVRVRLTVIRGEGGLYDVTNNFPNHIVETWELPPVSDVLNDGLAIDIFPDAIIAADRFSNVKSNNYLPYLMGALFAKENRLNDCLLLNHRGNLADATIANIFIAKDGRILTPPLSDGCVAGVMRRHLLQVTSGSAAHITEQSLTLEDLTGANEVFLSNAISGVRWVKQFRNVTYEQSVTARLFSTIIKKLF
jgi:branched-chain amino acid aminotransferase